MKRHSTQHKNSVFCLLFDNPHKLRNLYNALTGSSYSEDTPVSIATLKDALVKKIRNDIAFTIGGKTIILAEHQSTVNPNMPVRLLLYIAAIYEKLLPRKNLYGKRMVKIPRPEFYLFYNGRDAFPDKTTLRLSPSFEKVQGAEKSFLELEVKAYNINAGHNKELLRKNRDLGEYARFVEVVRKKQAGRKNKEEAFRLAILECIEHNILREFLEEHREEVMSCLDISWEEYVEIRTKDAVEEAEERGHAKGRAETLKEALEKGRAALKEAEEKNRQKTLESARKMKAAGLSASQIKTFTDLPLRVIKKL